MADRMPPNFCLRLGGGTGASGGGATLGGKGGRLSTVSKSYKARMYSVKYLTTSQVSDFYILQKSTFLK